MFGPRYIAHSRLDRRVSNVYSISLSEHCMRTALFSCIRCLLWRIAAAALSCLATIRCFFGTGLDLPHICHSEYSDECPLKCCCHPNSILDSGQLASSWPTRLITPSLTGSATECSVPACLHTKPGSTLAQVTTPPPVAVSARKYFVNTATPVGDSRILSKQCNFMLKEVDTMKWPSPFFIQFTLKMKQLSTSTHILGQLLNWWSHEREEINKIQK